MRFCFSTKVGFYLDNFFLGKTIASFESFNVKNPNLQFAIITKKTCRQPKLRLFKKTGLYKHLKKGTFRYVGLVIPFLFKMIPT